MPIDSVNQSPLFQTGRLCISLEFLQCKDAISFPMNLDLTDYVHPVNEKSQTSEGVQTTADPELLEYTLTGIILHRGTSASAGHYVAIVKDERTGDWWKYDDESVTNMGTHPFKGAKWDPVSGDDPSGSSATGAKKGGAVGKGGAAGAKARGGRRGVSKRGRGRGGTARSRAGKAAAAVAEVIDIDAEQSEVEGGTLKAGALKRGPTNLAADECATAMPASKIPKQEDEPGLGKIAVLLAYGEGAVGVDLEMKVDEGTPGRMGLLI